MWPSKTRRTPGTYILRPEAATAPCDRRSQDSITHRGLIFGAGGRNSCLWEEPTRLSESHFPPKTGRMVTLVIISMSCWGLQCCNTMGIWRGTLLVQSSNCPPRALFWGALDGRRINCPPRALFWGARAGRHINCPTRLSVCWRKGIWILAHEGICERIYFSCNSMRHIENFVCIAWLTTWAGATTDAMVHFSVLIWIHKLAIFYSL